MPTSYVFDTLNNKYPCEGPRVVETICDFSTASSFDVDLKSLVMQGKISNVQSLFVDNSTNSAPLVIKMSNTNQRIIIPSYSQAYISVLLNQPQFSVSTTSIATVFVYAQNFPVQNAIWAASDVNNTGQNVSVVNFPVTQFTALMPNTNNTFKPVFPGYNLATGTTSASVAVATAVGVNMRICNTGTVLVTVRYGAGPQTALTNDLAIAPNQSVFVDGSGVDTVAAISSAASSINIICGYNGLSAN